MNTVSLEQLASILNKYNLRLVSLEKRIGELEGDNAHLQRFQKPSVEAIGAYAKDIGFKTLDPEQFWNFYEGKGWRVGKTPMKDWKRAVHTWKLREPVTHETKSVQEMFGNT